MKAKKIIIMLVIISMSLMITSFCYAESLTTEHSLWSFNGDYGLRCVTAYIDIKENYTTSNGNAIANSHDLQIYGWPDLTGFDLGLIRTNYKVYSYPDEVYQNTAMTLHESDYLGYSIIYPSDGRSYWVCGKSTSSVTQPYLTTSLMAEYYFSISMPDDWSPGFNSYIDTVYCYR